MFLHNVGRIRYYRNYIPLQVMFGRFALLGAEFRLSGVVVVRVVRHGYGYC